MEALWKEWIASGLWYERLVALVLDHPMFQLIHVNTFQIAAALFVVTMAMAMLNFAVVNIPSEARERRKSEGDKRHEFSDRDLRRSWRARGLWEARNARRQKRGRPLISEHARLQWGEVLLRFPEHVAGGLERVIDLIQKTLYWSNVVIVLAALALPFVFELLIFQIYALYPDIPEPSGAFLDELSAFQTVLRRVYFGYMAAGAAWAAGAVGLVLESRRPGRRRSARILTYVGVLAAASAPLVYFFVKMTGLYFDFFNPAGGHNAGYSVFYASTSGDMLQNIKAQLLLAPVHALPISAALAPVTALALVAITVLFKKRERQSRWRRAFRNAVAPIAPGLVVSFCVTIVAAGLGGQFGGGQVMRPAPAFLLLNAVGDALTILSTFAVLVIVKALIRRADGTSFFKIFTSAPLLAATTLLIVADIAGAAVVAIYVVHWGAASSGQTVSLHEASLILFGLAETGAQRFEFDSLFWIMHTTFAPTLVFFSVLMMSVLATPVMIVRVIYARFLGIYEWISRVVEIVLVFVLPGYSIQFVWWAATRIFNTITFETYYEYAQYAAAVLQRLLPSTL